MADRLAENGAIQYALANPEAGSKRAALSGYIMGALTDWLRNPFPPLSRLAAPGRLRGQFFDSGVAPLAMDFTTDQYASGSANNMAMKSFSDIVTFSRTSNATITKSDGTIGYAPHNLLTYSEQFDNATWSKTGTTITSNLITAPNGTTTADKIVEVAGAATPRITSATAVTLVPYTISIYAKAAERTQIRIVADASAGKSAYYDLSNGTVFSVGGASTASITFDSDGWYRCVLTYTPFVTNNGFYIATAEAGAVITSGDNTKGIYLWGAQLEIGSTATTYNSTTVKNLLGYTEAFDNAAWTKSNSFVQTNLLTYSEAFDNAGWVKTGTTISGNAEISPNGYQTADTIIEDTSTGTHGISQALSLTNTTITLSFYAKSAGRSWIRLGHQDVNTTVWFNISTGVKGTVNSLVITSDISPVGNGWYRCVVTVPITTAGSFNMRLADANGSYSYTGNGTSGVYAWGAQLVQGSVAGDYRRTDAAALPVFYANHNGVVCAEQLQPSAANGTILESYTATGGSMTFSIWMRRITGTGNVDLTMDTGVTYTTQSITTSWARYSVTSTPASGARTAGVRLVTSGDVIQVFGAQVSDSASLDPYVLNAAAAPSAQAYYGARFDYDPVTLAAKGLLVEEQRINLLLNSSIAGTSLATQNITTTAAARTLSFYGTGTVTLSGTHSATVVGTGTYPTRTTYTYTPTAGTLTLTVSGTVQYAQDELGSFATSFIPTGSSSATRAADVAVIQGSNFYSWYNQNQGSVYCNAVSNGISSAGTSTFWAISDNTINNRMRFNSGGGTFDVLANGTTQASIVNSYTLGTLAKVASAYTTNSFNSAINNTLGTEDTSGITPIVTQMQLGNLLTSRELNGTIKQISYYNTRLPNSTLQSLTS
jgi:hypothetical protein